jgi:hypothetical protein
MIKTVYFIGGAVSLLLCGSKEKERKAKRTKHVLLAFL